ncbi:MAG: glutamine--fructose-6-phosphate transaminase (isomerizing) [Candidatus Aenigmarchaeota archaeon]|nr:glutamine--fructose-6-phosphate transaminase (isomerizing) [Candidatus Aenigmarchaeota archaeon]
MCGIIGYIGPRQAAPILVKGIKRLEYRGYDSVGMAVVNGSIDLKKQSGMIDEVNSALNLDKMQGMLGIAHTRWATHGEPSGRNAHPHADCTGEIAVVHNGIIENHATLRKLLEREGHVIASDTDSEVISHLIEKFYEGNLEDAVRKCLLQLQGTYGLAVVHKNERKIVVARNGSPLVIGTKKGETFAASDASAILEHTKKMMYLDDREIGIIGPGTVVVKNLQDKTVDKDTQDIGWDLEQMEKGGFKHFMLKEIFEQPESLQNAMRGRLGPKIKLSINSNMEGCERVILIACGTSWHAALIGRYLLEDIAKVPTEVDYASEFRYRDPLVTKKDLVVFISQSGETADTLAALREAKKKGAKTLGIINVVGSTIAREADMGIYLHAGPEIGVASTKAFSSQLVSLCLLALFLKQKRTGEIDGEEFTSELRRLPGKIESVLKNCHKIRDIARAVYKHGNFLYLGRGINFPVALEGALKLKEISYIHAEGYPAAEMKHGPIALIDENMPVVFIANKGKGYDKTLSNMEEVKARHGKIIAIATEGDEDIRRLADGVIYVPETLDNLTPIINAVPLQLLAYYIADMKGLNVDKPRNLAKSVTVE